MNRFRHNITLILSLLSLVFFTNLCIINTFASSNSKYVSEGFEIDDELLKCATDSTNTWLIDTNNDGIITLQEWNAQTNLLLDCKNYNITDWSALKELGFMNQLIIKNIEKIDLSILCETTGISSVELYVEDFKDITGMNSENLQPESLAIFCNNPIDINDLNKCHNVENLTLSAPSLTNYDVISSLSKLSTLNIYTTSADSLNFTNNNKNIKKLKISCKPLTDLSFLTKFSNLDYLDLSGCGITDASLLQQLKGLRVLNLSNNNISDISWINNIHYIYLSGNPLDLESTLLAFIGLGNSKEIVTEEGTTHRLAFPQCDIIDRDSIVLTTSNKNNIRIQDSIDFIRNGTAAIQVFLNDEHVFDYSVNITTKTEGSYFYILKGDADNNELINAADALKLLKITATLENMDSNFSIRKNDFDGNYIINAEDALHILKIAAKLEEPQTIDDPENFYSEVDYKNGYPTSDFISRDLSQDTYYTYKEGFLNISDRGGSFYKILNGDYTGLLSIPYEEAGFDKIYWQFRWLIEDAITNNLLEQTNKLYYDFRTEQENSNSFNGYWLQTNAFAEILIGHQCSLNFYISDNNELYLYQGDRRDLFYPDTNYLVFRYTGELPDGLTYDSINSFYNYYSNKQIQ